MKKSNRIICLGARIIAVVVESLEKSDEANENQQFAFYLYSDSDQQSSLSTIFDDDDDDDERKVNTTIKVCNQQQSSSDETRMGRLSTFAKNRILNLRFQKSYRIKQIAQTLLTEDNIKVGQSHSI